jgi:hypothetical protein
MPIDAAALPYIDLGASEEVLRAYALDHFGKKIHPNAKGQTVVDRFAAIYEEETGVKLQPVENDFGEDDGDDTDVAATTDQENKPPERKPIAATIIVQEDEKDPAPICGSVNFVAYRIMRNVEVRVSMPILNSLRNAKKTVYNPKTMESKEVLAYPFSVVQYHYAGE